MFKNLVWKTVFVLFAFAIPLSVEGQGGQVIGTVTHSGTGEAIAVAQLYIDGASIGTLTSNDGSFRIAGVPTGPQVLIVERLGLETVRQDITVIAGQDLVVNFTMRQTALMIEGIVVTGLIDPVAGLRAPISVSRIDRTSMPVVATGAAIENLQGRMAGVRINRRNGQPGTPPTIQLRTPTSVFGGGSPLIVVDGVILGGQGLSSTTDISAMDVESIEVIRGAAAASLYGSRASAGVISITTMRGGNLNQGQTRIQVRSELGFSQAVGNVNISTAHKFQMNAAGTSYVDANGVDVGRADRFALDQNIAFIDKDYPTGTELFDNIAGITRPGAFRNNSVSISGRGQNSNYAVSFNNNVERGSLEGNRGYERNSLRVNVDQRPTNTLSIGSTFYHARDNRENILTESSGAPFRVASRTPPDIDFTLKDDDGLYIQQPDPLIDIQNPLWENQVKTDIQDGTRTLIGMNLNYSPASWITLSGTAGYDRQTYSRTRLTPKGTPGDIPDPDDALDGEIRFNDTEEVTWNGEAQLTLRRDYGGLNLRTTFRGLLEKDDYSETEQRGRGFILFGVPQIENTQTGSLSGNSEQRQIKSNAYLVDVALDYEGKYILTALGRRDGSSLFGSGNRWHNYYRVAAAWRLSEESWFDLPNVSEFKVSVARGTAGGRPNFHYQYETWTLRSGIPTKGTLGNTDLAPEHTTENEVSLNMLMYGRVGFRATYAWQETSGQMGRVDLPVLTGYRSQWVNEGTISGNTLELELEMQLVNRANFSWQTLIVGDYSYAEITEWNNPCTNRGLGWRFNCIDVPIYGIFSFLSVRSHSQLQKHRDGEAVPFADEFQVNDEGYLVWVGKGNNYTEGIIKELWGTESGTIGGRTYKWGQPFFEQNVGGNVRQLLGESNPVNFGWINNVRIGRLSLHAQLDASVGFDINNTRVQQMSRTNRETAPEMDQRDKPEGLKKPVGYYRAAIDGDGSYVIVDGSFLKLRTLSATYRFDAAQLGGWGMGAFDNLSIGLSIRNVYTLTNYTGYDPDQGIDLQTRRSSDNSSADYPTSRSFTAEVSVTF